MNAAKEISARTSAAFPLRNQVDNESSAHCDERLSTSVLKLEAADGACFLTCCGVATKIADGGQQRAGLAPSQIHPPAIASAYVGHFLFHRRIPGIVVLAFLDRSEVRCKFSRPGGGADGAFDFFAVCFSV